MRLAVALGFELDRVAGSHHIFIHTGHNEAQLNLQPDKNGQAKPYQIKQLLRLAEGLSDMATPKPPKYHINVFYSPEDKAYIADVPDLKHCSAHGDTPADAVREVMTAIEAWIKTAKKHGKPVPKPRYRPAMYQLAG